MNQDNIYKKLRIICLILAIVCMSLSLLKKANAEELPDEAIEYLSDTDLGKYIDGTSDTTLINAFNDALQMPYFVHIKSNRTSNNRDYYIFTDKENIGFWYINNTNYYSFPAYLNNAHTLITNDDSISSVNSIIFQTYNLRGTISIVFGSRRTQSFNSGSGIRTSKTSWTNTVFYGNMNNAQNPEFTFPYDSTNKICYGRFFCMANAGNSLSNNSIGFYIDQIELRPKTNTEGFDVYKYGSSGSERLVCDFSSCISISNAVGNSSTIQIDITIDGVDQTFNFDSTSSYYDYSVSGWRALYSIPFTAFGINSNTISARLTNVTVANTTSSPGGSGTININWITPLTLVGSDYEDLEPSNIPKEQMPDFDYYDDPATQTNYNGTMNRWLTGPYASFDYTLFTRWNFEPKYVVVPIIYADATQAAKLAFKAFIESNYRDMFDVITLVNNSDINNTMVDWLNNHLYITDIYDIIVFAFEPAIDGDIKYYTFTTDSYNNHLNNSLMYDLIQQVADDGKALEKTYDFIYDRLNDFEDKSLTKLNEMIGLQELENGFISSLQSILNQILNALLNLNIDIPEADYSSITSRLDQIISNQGSDNLNSDWYQNYRSWLYAQDSTDNIISPHEFFIEIFDPIKNTYDAFVNNNSIAGYIADMDLFVEYLSGKIDDNLSIYFKDSIGSPSFDINDNTMLTAGGIQ